MKVRKRQFRKHSENYVEYGLTAFDDKPELVLFNGLSSEIYMRLPS
jgi:hypothetical protein